MSIDPSFLSSLDPSAIEGQTPIAETEFALCCDGKS